MDAHSAFGLLIRRSLVRVQVGEPKKSISYNGLRRPTVPQNSRKGHPLSGHFGLSRTLILPHLADTKKHDDYVLAPSAPTIYPTAPDRVAGSWFG